jgi:ATP-dependent helicase Lhr and Lhr-like helicase
VDWNRKIAYAEPAQETGRSRWVGSSVALSSALCASIRDLLNSTEQDPRWSRRSVDRFYQIRQDLSPCCDDDSVLRRNGQSLEWWTFAGLSANLTVVRYLQPFFESTLRADNLWIKLPPEIKMEQLNNAVKEILSNNVPPEWELEQPAAGLLKFGDLLPEYMLRDLIMARIADIPRAREILGTSMRML